MIDSLKSELIPYTQELVDETGLMEIMPNDVFFYPEYHQLFSKSDPVIFIHKDKDRIFCLPFLKKPIDNTSYFDLESAYGYGGPFSNSSDQKFIEESWKALESRLYENNVVGGFIRFNPFLNNHELTSESVISVQRICPIVSLFCQDKSLEDIWKDYNKNTRNKIRKANKVKLGLEIGSDKKAMTEFIEMYNKSMDRLGAEGQYYFSDDFFFDLSDKMSSAMKILFAKQDGKITGTALLLISQNVMTYFLSATNDQGRTNGSAHFLRHRAIEFALQKGISKINFGGGKTNEIDDSLLKFKMGFSNTLEDYYIGKMVINKEVYKELCDSWTKDSDQGKIQKFGSLHLKYRY